MFRGYKWYHCVCFILGFLFLLAVTIYVIAVYGDVEAVIPTHYNGSGAADGYGSKSSLITLIVFGWILYGMMVIVGFFPQLWNTGVTVTVFNRDRIYAVIRTMLSILTLLMAAFFASLIFFSCRCRDLPKSLLPAFVILLAGTLIISIIRLIRNR